MKHFLAGFAVTVAAVIVGVVAAPYVTGLVGHATGTAKA